ncbi:MAG: filamentous hemagglutinin N-terminal domain-containing protein, partial [Betaproteobacteria bacterium]
MNRKNLVQIAAPRNRIYGYVRVRITRRLWTTYRVRVRGWLSHAMAALLTGFFASSAIALPSGGNVVSGEATIEQHNSATTVVRQESQRAAINWQSFNVARGETVQFIQPNSRSVALNRVVGGDPSRIFGSLTSNGAVFLLNPAGVYFAPGASVNTGALLASTLAMSDADFSAGRYVLSGSSSAAVVNQGDIRIGPGGYAVLAGAKIDNQGTITAPNGSVALLAGSRVAIDIGGDNAVTFSVDGGALRATVDNSGAVVADGGRILLQASALDGAMTTAVNQTGLLRANSISESNGVVTLKASGGDTVVTGRIEATGLAAGQTGGRVEVFGDRVGLFNQAAIDARGAAGGGTVLVGGDYQGGGGAPRAQTTIVDAGASIVADATVAGNGGTVVVWADDATRFSGAISARGGDMGGDGGQVETSGKVKLSITTGAVDVGASAGRGGTWLLDPNNLTIRDNGGVADPSVTPPPTSTFNTLANDAVLDTKVLGDALKAGANVKVFTADAAPSGQNGNITVQDTVTATGNGATLTLAAQGDIVFATNATITKGTNTALNVNLHAGTDAAGENPGTKSSTITMNTGSGIDAGTGAVNAVSKGNVLLARIAAGSLTVQSNGGSIFQTVGAQAFTINGATNIDAGAGDILLNNVNNNFGSIGLTGGAISVADGTGGLTVTGVSSGANKAVSLVSTGGTLTLP